MNRLFIFSLALTASFSFKALAQNEVPLNTGDMVLPFGSYLERVNWFRDRYTGLEDFTAIQRERVSYAALENAEEAMEGPHSANYIKGMRIYYGLTLHNEIILYYVPLFANRTGVSGSDNTFEVLEPEGGFEGVLADDAYAIYYAHEGQLYDLRADGVELEDAPLNVSRYRFNVRTKTGYEMDETYSSFIPFQEINKLYDDNRNSDYNTGSIFFNSGAQFAGGKYSHRLVLSTIRSYEEPYQHNSSFLGMAADMIKGCPPECSSITYPVN